MKSSYVFMCFLIFANFESLILISFVNFESLILINVMKSSYALISFANFEFYKKIEKKILSFKELTIYKMFKSNIIDNLEQD